MTPVMLIISHLATIGAGVLCVVLFWGIDREMGYWVIINNLIKLTACVYRPWIRDARIEPPERALRTATGYSFPSGHTQFAASSYGSLAQRCGRGRKVLYGFCAAMIFLAAFSRNYLGVHTPQDVIVAILCSFAIIKFCAVMESKVRENPALLDKLLLACCVIAVLCAVYFHGWTAHRQSAGNEGRRIFFRRCSPGYYDRYDAREAVRAFPHRRSRLAKSDPRPGGTDRSCRCIPSWQEPAVRIDRQGYRASCPLRFSDSVRGMDLSGDIYSRQEAVYQRRDQLKDISWSK